MKLTKYVVFILFVASFLHAQEKYLVYFSDKGSLNKKSLQKTSDKEILAKKFLSPKSIERRKKNMGDDFITFGDLPIAQEYIQNLNENGIKIINKLKWFNAVSVYLMPNELENIKKFSFVTKIEKVRKYKTDEPSSSEINQPTTLNKNQNTNAFDYGNSLTQNQLSDIPQVHNLGITGEGVTIGILDTGFDWKIPNSLKSRNVIAERDFIFKDNNTANETGIDAGGQHNHGTSVFSILAGFDEGNLIGPAFNSSFLLAKTEYIPTETHAEEDNYAAALEWMDSIGVDITTSSLGYSEFDATDFSYTYNDMDGKTTIVTKAAEFAFDRGIVCITSAGNEGSSSWHYITAPGDGINTITVGAVNSLNTIASFSSRGPSFDGRIKPEIVAQGVSVFNTLAGSASSYSFGNGTSYSAPIVAGVTGLLLSAHPHLVNKQVRHILIQSGGNLQNPDNNIGYGLLSAIKAISYPNFEVRDGKNYINKIFSELESIKENSIELHTEDGTAYSMVKVGGNYFTIELPNGITKESNKVYFTYKNLQDNLIKEPQTDFYNLYLDGLISNVEINPIVQLPNKFSLGQNYPNPFNPTTRIEYFVPNFVKSTKVLIKLYDILGNEIKTLVNEDKKPGNHFVDFSAGSLSSGVYFYQLKTSEFSLTKKMTIIK